MFIAPGPMTARLVEPRETQQPNVNKAPQPHESPPQVVKPSVVSGGDATISCLSPSPSTLVIY
jgi:hypothetical protein